MKKIVILIGGVILTVASFAQVQFTRNGKISFFSTTAVEDIKAQNTEVVSFLDTQKGDLRFQVLIKGFVFPKAAMQQHFNSKEYMYSDSFPQSAFKGSIINLKDVNFSKDGNYKIQVKGDLTMHGVTKPVIAGGTISIVAGVVSTNAVIKINREDYKIIVPAFTNSKIAKTIEITVDCKYAIYK